jgi:hypothetical protein
MQHTALFLTIELALKASCMRINRGIPSTVEARSAWNFLGCYTDNVSGRALLNGEAVPGGTSAMTNEVCQSTCLAAGFLIAGTEYGGECCKFLFQENMAPIEFDYFLGCGNSIVNGGSLAPDGSAGCNMACNGNSAEIYGGPNRLDVYQYSSSGSGGGGSTGIGKRGLAYNNNNPDQNAEYANLFTGYSKITWGYDWGYPAYNLDSSFEL